MEEQKNPAFIKAEKASGIETVHTSGNGAEKQAEKAEKLERQAERRKYRAMVNSGAEDYYDEPNGRDRKSSRHGGRGGWIAAVVTLSCAVLILTGLLAYNFFAPEPMNNDLESVYRKSFYDTVTYVDNLDLNMSKMMASRDAEAEQKYLVTVAVNAELAENDLGQLPLEDESKFYTTKLINQVSDYAKYLNNKLIDGDPLTENDYKNFETLHNGVLQLKESLAEISDNMDGFNFTKMPKENNVLLDNLTELQNLSSEYPELIYDGPFSDGRNKKTPKAISGDEVSENDAINEVIRVFGSYGVDKADVTGETSGEIPAYTVTAMGDYGEIFAEVSKQGGKIILFTVNSATNETEEEYEDRGATEEEISTAIEFLSLAGIKSVKAVWTATAGNATTINFVYTQDGVIIYPDMIKIKVSLTTGKVIGMEAFGYYMNHSERSLKKVTISEESAKANLSADIEVSSTRLTLIPKSETVEELCYEFAGTLNGATYYIYVSAVSGKQVEMFKVVKGSEGELLM